MARRPLRNPNQLDLFTRPVASPVVVPMEPRGSMGTLPEGWSHERRAPGLSAVEAIRVLSCQPIEHTGYRWQDGSSCCSSCFPTVEKAGADRGRGFRMSVYKSREALPLVRCFACQVPFPGETAEEELRRRTPVS